MTDNNNNNNNNRPMNIWEYLDKHSGAVFWTLAFVVFCCAAAIG